MYDTVNVTWQHYFPSVKWLCQKLQVLQMGMKTFGELSVIFAVGRCNQWLLGASLPDRYPGIRLVFLPRCNTSDHKSDTDLQKKRNCLTQAITLTWSPCFFKLNLLYARVWFYSSLVLLTTTYLWRLKILINPPCKCCCVIWDPFSVCVFFIAISNEHQYSSLLWETAESPSRKDLMVLFVYLKTASGKKLHYFCSELFVVLVQKIVNLKESF